MIRGIKSFISIITTVLLLISTMLGFYGTDGTKNEYKTYKNVILMIGDGMGFNTVEAAKSRYGIDELPMETFPVHSQSKTRSASNKITDSSPTYIFMIHHKFILLHSPRTGGVR